MQKTLVRSDLRSSRPSLVSEVDYSQIAITKQFLTQEESIRRCIEEVEIEVLLLALYPRVGDVRCFHDSTFFLCPCCQLFAKRMFADAPQAYLRDETSWKCMRCRSSGSRYELERSAFENPGALDRLLTCTAEES